MTYISLSTPYPQFELEWSQRLCSSALSTSPLLAPTCAILRHLGSTSVSGDVASLATLTLLTML